MKRWKAPPALGSGPQLPSQGGTIPRQGPRLDPHPALPSTGHLANGLDYQHPQGCPWAKAPKDAATHTGVPQGSFSSPVVLPDGRFCPRSWWECRDQFRESHCWVKGSTRSHLDASATACHEAPPRGGGACPGHPWKQRVRTLAPAAGGRGRNLAADGRDGQRLGSRVQQLFSLSLPKSAGVSPIPLRLVSRQLKEAGASVYLWCECELEQLLWKTVWGSSRHDTQNCRMFQQFRV